MEFMKIVPADTTIAELEKKAAEADARKQSGPQAEYLRSCAVSGFGY